MKVLFRKYSNTYAVLIIILLLGLFLRIYKLEIFYSFGHDQDLSAWIAKDMIIDHHFRLIGQETSVLGVFIGPLFYYLIAASFAILKMNPLSGALVTTSVSLFTIVSIYWVFNNFFGRNVGLIGSFLYAVTPGTIFGDRWVVPTQPTLLWSTWFLYVLFSVLKGNFRVLIPLSILIGLIWHIHIAFIPLLILLPMVFLLSDNRKVGLKYDFKIILASIAILLILLSPFIVFELRHNGLQMRSLIAATHENKDSLTGFNRVIKVFDASSKLLFSPFVFNDDRFNITSISFITLLPLIFLSVMIYLTWRRVLTRRQLILIIVWYSVVLLAQFLSQKPISEYYFSNLLILVFLIVALFLNTVNDVSKRFPLVSFLLMLYVGLILLWLITKPEGLSGFVSKKKAIEYIKKNSSQERYMCIGINHIEPPQSVNSGFRYLFWYYGLQVITPGNDVPVYSIVNPWTISKKEEQVRFGDIGVILPIVKKVDPHICSDPNRQLLPLWGFNN